MEWALGGPGRGTKVSAAQFRESLKAHIWIWIGLRRTNMVINANKEICTSACYLADYFGEDCARRIAPDRSLRQPMVDTTRNLSYRALTIPVCSIPSAELGLVFTPEHFEFLRRLVEYGPIALCSHLGLQGIFVWDYQSRTYSFINLARLILSLSCTVADFLRFSLQVWGFVAAKTPGNKGKQDPGDKSNGELEDVLIEDCANE